MTFSKKMQIAGYYTKADLVPDQPYRVFNTWMGDPSKVLMLEAVIDCVERDGLIANARETGDALKGGLEALAVAYPGKLMNVRGVGTLVAADPASVPRGTAPSRNSGLRESDIAHCGEAAIRCRPGLYFTPEHARVFLDAFDRVLRRM